MTRPMTACTGRALQAGNVNAAICTDCPRLAHRARLTDPATEQVDCRMRALWIPQTCAKCHSTIYAQYHDSVHGAALTQEGNPDVPTCIDCHGVHNIGDPTTAAFRLKSPEICAKCHTDPAIMDKYGISTQVLNTYVADFHGTTVTLFEKQSPDAETNKPVCFDCHGVHDIARTDDPQKGLELKENILKRCQVCHPTATDEFLGRLVVALHPVARQVSAGLLRESVLSHLHSGRADPHGDSGGAGYQLGHPPEAAQPERAAPAARRKTGGHRLGRKRSRAMSSTTPPQQPNPAPEPVSQPAAPVQTVTRFAVLERIEHFILLLSFTTAGCDGPAAEVCVVRR